MRRNVTKPEQWLRKHMKSMKTQPNGDKHITFRIDSMVVTKEVTAAIWQNALHDSAVMAELRSEIVRSMWRRIL